MHSRKREVLLLSGCKRSGLSVSEGRKRKQFERRRNAGTHFVAWKSDIFGTESDVKLGRFRNDLVLRRLKHHRDRNVEAADIVNRSDSRARDEETRDAAGESAFTRAIRAEKRDILVPGNSERYGVERRTRRLGIREAKVFYRQTQWCFPSPGVYRNGFGKKRDATGKKLYTLRRTYIP